jgi:hypothetical protein
MLGFKEYALLTFDHSFTERIRNHFLKYIGSNLPLYLQDPAFLQKLTDKSGKKDKGIKYFIGQINEAGTIYFNLYNKFKGQQGIGSQINYYRLAAYYTKLNGLTYTKTQGESLIVEADSAIKEIFAEKLYDYLLAISTAKTYEKKETNRDIIQKTFVPDSSPIPQTLNDAMEGSPIPPPIKSLLYDNTTTTFEGRLFTVAHYDCKHTGAGSSWLCKGHSNWQSEAYAKSTGWTKTVRLKKLVELYKQDNNIENTQFPDSDGFPYKYNSFQSYGDYPGDRWGKENQFYIDRWPGSDVCKSIGTPGCGKGLPTTNETTFTSLLSAGTYVEFFFKFNFDELAGHLTGAAYEKGISNIFDHEGSHGHLFGDFVSSISKTDFSLPAGKGKYNARLYYSLEKFSRLIRDIYLYVSRETWPNTDPELGYSLPTEGEIDKAFENTKIEFGARLIVSTPNLSEETNSDKIMSVNKYFASGDELLKDAEKYSEFYSAWKNKTFIYNFFSHVPKEDDGDDGSSSPKDAVIKDNPDNLGVSTVYCFPIAEKSVELTNEDKKEFLLDFYAGIPRWKMPGLETGDPHAGMIDVDFSLDQAVVGKYSKSILDNLFDDAFVDNFVSSILFGKQDTLSVEQYEKAAQSVGEPLFIENSPDRNSWIAECNKTDDKIDQNLITLIDSIEGF